MKMIRVVKAFNINKSLQRVINNNLSYNGMDDRGMINPSPLLKKYEDMYEGIRPKDIDFGHQNSKAYIKYVSQACDDSNAMFNLVYDAISKDSNLKDLYDKGNLKIQVCDRNHWGQWNTFSINEKEEFDLDQLIEDAEYLFDNEEDSDLLYEFADFMGVSVEKTDNIDKMIRQNPEKAEKFIRNYIG